MAVTWRKKTWMTTIQTTMTSKEKTKTSITTTMTLVAGLLTQQMLRALHRLLRAVVGCYPPYECALTVVCRMVHSAFHHRHRRVGGDYQYLTWHDRHPHLRHQAEKDDPMGGGGRIIIQRRKRRKKILMTNIHLVENKEKGEVDRGEERTINTIIFNLH